MTQNGKKARRLVSGSSSAPWEIQEGDLHYSLGATWYETDLRGQKKYGITLVVAGLVKWKDELERFHFAGNDLNIQECLRKAFPNLPQDVQVVGGIAGGWSGRGRVEMSFFIPAAKPSAILCASAGWKHLGVSVEEVGQRLVSCCRELHNAWKRQSERRRLVQEANRILDWLVDDIQRKAFVATQYEERKRALLMEVESKMRELSSDAQGVQDMLSEALAKSEPKFDQRAVDAALGALSLAVEKRGAEIGSFTCQPVRVKEGDFREKDENQVAG